MRASVASSRESQATILPLNMTAMRSQSRRNSGVSEEETSTPIAVSRGGDQESVDLRLGADVDATGRLVEHQHARLAREPLAEHDLLLVPARERRDRTPPASGL